MWVVMEPLSKFADRPRGFAARYIRRRAGAHIAIVASVLGAVACSVGSQYGVKFLIDSLSGVGGDHARVWLAFALLTGLIAADNLLWRVGGWLACSAFVAVTGDVRADLFRHLTGHAPSFFAEEVPGTLTSRVTAASNAIYIAETMTVWNVLPPCAATLGAIGLLALVSVPIAALMTVVALGMIVLLFYLAARGRAHHRDYASKAAQVDGEMADIVNNLPLVRAFGGRRREQRRLEAALDGEMTARRRSLYYLERLRLLHAAITAAFTAGILAWAVHLWENGHASTGDVVLVCTLGFTVLHSTRDLAVALVDLTQHLARFTEALSTLLTPHTITDRPGAKPLRIREGAITFEHVSFAYPDGLRVLRGFDLHIRGGERIGLVGASGCGKSTIFSLLQRFYEVSDGAILIDGQNVADVTQASLHQAIAYVSQTIELFHRSVRENIRYGRPEASDDEVMAAAEAAHCRDFIMAMPGGFDTIVGDRGVKLSGGQRQRIAMARALLKGAPILLLDEATSALDVESEAAVRDAIDELARGRTVIAVAHRLATLRDFDRIVVIDQGKVCQDGAPAQLVRSAGPYRGLIEREAAHMIHPAA